MSSPHFNEYAAMAFCIAAHEAIGQKRKYTGENYWRHPLAVAEILKKNATKYTEEMVIAALLHDCVEDTQVGIETIESLFGSVVASYVSDLTDVSKPEDGNRAERKQIDREHTASASPNAKTIKLADLIHNTQSIFQYDQDFAKVYLEEKKLLLEVLTEGDKVLYKMAYDLAYGIEQ